MSNRNLKPRSKSRYDSRVHGERNMYGAQDDHSLRRDLCPVTLIRPEAKKGPMITRIWPVLAEEDPSQLLAGRLSTAKNDFSNFMVRVDMARYVGIRKPGNTPVSFVLDDPTNEDPDQRSIYRDFYWNCKAAMKAGEFGAGRAWDAHWNQLMVGEGGSAQLSAPTGVWMAQGIVLANGQKDYTTGSSRRLPLGMSDEDPLVVFQISDYQGKQYRMMLGKEKQNKVGDAKKPWQDFLYGDPVGVYDEATSTLKGGLITSWFNPKHTQPRGKYHSWDGKVPANNIQGGEVEIMTAWKSGSGTTYRADLDAKQTERVKDKWMFWWDDPATDQLGLIYVAPKEQQMLWIVNAFRSAPRMIEFAFADREAELFTDEIKAILRERKQASVPGMPGEAEEATQSTRRTDPTQGAEAADEPSFEDAPADDAPGETDDSAQEPVDTASEAGDSFDAPADDAPADETPTEDAAGDEPPAEEQPTDDVPADEPAEGDPAAAEAGTDENLFNVDDDPATDESQAGDEGGFEESVTDPEPLDSSAEEPPAEESFEDPPPAPARKSGKPAAGSDDAAARMRATMAAARQRSNARAEPPAATKPAASKPAAAPAKPTAAPAKPATSKPAAAPAKPTAAPAKPATGKPAASAKPEGKTPAPARPAPAVPTPPPAAAKPARAPRGAAAAKK